MKHAGKVRLEHFVESDDAQAKTLGKPERIRLPEVVENGCQLCRGLGLGHTRLEPPHEGEVALPLYFRLAGHADGQVNIAPAPQKPRWHYADNGARMPIEVQHLAKNRRASSVMRLPVAITQQSYFVMTVGNIVLADVAAENRCTPNTSKVLGVM